MEQGIDLQNEALIQVLENKVSMGAVREVHLEAAVQQLLAESHAMSGKIMDLETQLHKQEQNTEVVDVASTD